MDCNNLKVAIIPPAALGDVTIYLRMAWVFHAAGAQVCFHSSVLYSAREYFPWLRIEPSHDLALEQVASDNELVISYVNYLSAAGERQAALLARDNIAYVTAKKLPRALSLDGRAVTVRGRVFDGASRPLCLQSRAGLNMVEWVDAYLAEVFGLSAAAPVAVLLPEPAAASAARVVIFPTTPQPKKNYSATGFRLLAKALAGRGWCVEFVGMPAELPALTAQYQGFAVRTFADIKALMGYLSGCAAVISNDSGGGHLGSLMGCRTFTITRKSPRFVWRPGFNERNQVLAPLTSFKLLGRYIWRPFVPLWQIRAALGHAPLGRAADGLLSEQVD